MSNRTPGSGRRLVALAATLVAVGAAVVGQGLSSSSQAAPPVAAPVAAPAADDGVAEWTMMVYAVGDTPSVPDQMVQNLAQLAAVPDAPGVNVVVLLDLPEASDADAPRSTLPGLGPFSTAKLLVLDGGAYREVRDLGEVSMGRPDVLASFVAEAADRFPARHYGFTFFDHGGGNTGGYIDSGPPNTQQLSVPEMRTGLISGMQSAGIDRFDVIDHAACLMANYEAASALAPLARHLGASEEIMIGYPLAPVSLTPMAQGGTGRDVAESFVSGYVDFLDDVATDPGNQAYRDLVAMSVIDGEAMANLDRALTSFGEAAVRHLPEITTAVARARADALEYMIGFPGTEGQSEDLIDLGDFMAHLRDVPPDVLVARDAVTAALDRAVTLQATGRGTQQATGLSIYLPGNPRDVNQDVLTDGTEPPGWAEFVQAYVQSAAGSAGDTGGVGFVSKEAQILQADASGIKIAGTLTGGSSQGLASAETYVLTRIDGQQALGLVLPAYVDAGGPGQVQGVWDYSLTALTDGTTSAPASTQYQAQSGGLLGGFQARYTTPDGHQTDVGIRVLLSSQGEIESVTTVDLSAGSSAGIALQQGGTLTPYVFVPSSSGYRKQLSRTSVKISDQLRVDFVRQPENSQFDMALLVADAAGNVDFAAASARVVGAAG